MSRRAWITVGSLAALVALGWFAQWYYYPTVDESDSLPFAVSGESHGAQGRGTDSARVDSQVTLRIPNEQADAVYEYLRDKYVGRDNVLKERFPDLHLYGQNMSDTSTFVDEYFDSPLLQLYRNRNSARYRQRLNTTDPEDRKSGRELVQMKVTPPGRFDLRNELKYDVKPSRKLKTPDDLHPLIGLIDKSERDNFKKVFTDVGINPTSLSHVFTVTQTRRRGYLNWDQANILSFSVDQGTASILWATGRFTSVDLGIVEIAYTEADPAKREALWQIRDAIVKDLVEHFPALTVNSDSKYSIVLQQLLQQIPMIAALFRFHLL